MPPLDLPAHGPLRGQFGSFVLLSSVHGREAKLVLERVPDLRVVHMIRRPTDLLLSTYRYHKFLLTPEGARLRWDARVPDFANATSIEEGVRMLARDIKGLTEDIVTTHKALAGDPRALTLELADFGRDFNGTARRLYTHLYDAGAASLKELLWVSAEHDTKRWSKLSAQGTVVTSGTDKAGTADMPEAREVLLRLGRAHDPDVQHIFGAEEALGFPLAWQE